MKDFKGWIFGDENNKEWIQTIKQGRWDIAKKYKFRNPVKQNDNQIKIVKQILSKYGYNVPVYNVVAFGRDLLEELGYRSRI